MFPSGLGGKQTSVNIRLCVRQVARSSGAANEYQALCMSAGGVNKANRLAESALSGDHCLSDKSVDEALWGLAENLHLVFYKPAAQTLCLVWGRCREHLEIRKPWLWSVRLVSAASLKHPRVAVGSHIQPHFHVLASCTSANPSVILQITSRTFNTTQWND